MKPCRAWVGFVVVGVAMAAFVGCGGGDSQVSGDGGALTKAELIERGDAICAEANSAVGELGAEAAASKVPDTIGESIAIYVGMVERLESLGTPVDDDGSYAAFRRAAQMFAKAEAGLKAATESYEPLALSEAATKASAALNEFRAQAAMYGFAECSQDAGSGG